MNHACTNRQNAIADYVLGALDEEQTQTLKRHIAGCAGCREYLGQLNSHSEALIACGAQIEAGMTARCEKTIEALHDVTPARSLRIVPLLGRFARTAVAAVLVLGAGIAIGRVTAPRPVDVEQLRADVRESVLVQVDQRLTASNSQAVAEITEQTRRDLRIFATELISGTQTLVDRRFTEVVQLIEAGRLTDRHQVAKALDQIKTQTGMGLLRLAAWTEETPASSQN
jgi:anti-sigma-K factor RskA